jgi:hypothetical protein
MNCVVKRCLHFKKRNFICSHSLILMLIVEFSSFFDEYCIRVELKDYFGTK